MARGARSGCMAGDGPAGGASRYAGVETMKSGPGSGTQPTFHPPNRRGETRRQSSRPSLERPLQSGGAHRLESASGGAVVEQTIRAGVRHITEHLACRATQGSGRGRVIRTTCGLQVVAPKALPEISRVQARAPEAGPGSSAATPCGVLCSKCGGDLSCRGPARRRSGATGGRKFRVRRPHHRTADARPHSHSPQAAPGNDPSMKAAMRSWFRSASSSPSAMTRRR